jgi:DNA-binding XRE family transcriptional regulator
MAGQPSKACAHPLARINAAMANPKIAVPIAVACATDRHASIRPRRRRSETVSDTSARSGHSYSFTARPHPRRLRLERKGWKIGSAQELLQLSDEEAAYIELKLALSDRLKSLREKKAITQIEMAKLISSSQSRVAKMESGDPSVSIDLLVKALLALGATRRQIAGAMAASRAA